MPLDLHPTPLLIDRGCALPPDTLQHTLKHLLHIAVAACGHLATSLRLALGNFSCGCKSPEWRLQLMVSSQRPVRTPLLS